VTLLVCAAVLPNLCTPVSMQLGPNLQPLSKSLYNGQRVGLASRRFSAISVRISTTQSIFPIATDPKLTAGALGLRCSALKTNLCTPVSMPFGPNLRILPKSLYNGRRVGLASRWFSAISVRFLTIQSIFPIARDPKLTAHALGLRCSASKTTLCTPVSMLFGSSVRPLLKSLYNGRRVGPASRWFSAIYVRFSTTLSIFLIARDPKLTANALGLRCSAPKTNLCTPVSMPFGPNLPPFPKSLYNGRNVVLASRWFSAISVRFFTTQGIFSIARDPKLTTDALSFRSSAPKTNLCTPVSMPFGPNLRPLPKSLYNGRRVGPASTCFSAISVRFSTTQSIISIAGNPKLPADALGLRCSALKTNLCTRVLMPFGPSLRPLPKSLYNGRRVGLASRWFSATSVRFSTTQSIFPIAKDTELTADALGLRCSATKANFCTPVSMSFGPNLRPLPKRLYNGRKVDLASRWFSAISVRFSTTQSIFTIARDPKLTADALGLRFNSSETNLCTPVSMPFGPNPRPLPKSLYNGRTVGLASRWFSATSVPFSTAQGTFSIARDPKLTADALGLRCSAPKTNLCTPVSILFGPNLRPLPKSLYNGRRVGLASRWFSAISVRFSTTQSIFPIARDRKLTVDTLCLRCSAPKSNLCTPLSMPFSPNLRLLSKSVYNGRRVDFASRWFSATSDRFSTTQSIFPIARDPKLTADALGLRCSALKTNLSTPVSMPLGPNLRPLRKSLYNGRRVDLASRWFSAISVRFSRTQSIFPIARDPRLTADALGLRSSSLKTNFSTPVLMPFNSNVRPLLKSLYNGRMVGFASRWFSAISVRFSTTQRIFPIATEPKLTADALGLRCSAPKTN